MKNEFEQVLRTAEAALQTAEEQLCESHTVLKDIIREDDYIEIMNLMGRYASYHYYAEHINTYHFFALDNDKTTAELGSTGVYQGKEKLYQMFAIYHDYNNLPGTAHCHPINSPYIQVAKDGETAKGFWLTNGLEVLPPPPGQPPLSMWFLDGYYNEFIKTDEGWKWYHFHMLDDIKAKFDLSWSIMGKERNPGPDGLVPATYKTDSYEPYWSEREPSLEIDSLPDAYETMEE